MNQDGNLDAVIANDEDNDPPNGGVNRLCYGDGAGGFSNCVDIGPDGDDTDGVAVGLF